MAFNFNRSNCSTPSGVPGVVKIPCCRVYNPHLGVYEIVRATIPAQGEVFFMDAVPNEQAPGGYEIIQPFARQENVSPYPGYASPPLSEYGSSPIEYGSDARPMEFEYSATTMEYDFSVHPMVYGSPFAGGYASALPQPHPMELPIWSNPPPNPGNVMRNSYAAQQPFAQSGWNTANNSSAVVRQPSSMSRRSQLTMENMNSFDVPPVKAPSNRKTTGSSTPSPRESASDNESEEHPVFLDPEDGDGLIDLSRIPNSSNSNVLTEQSTQGPAQSTTHGTSQPTGNSNAHPPSNGTPESTQGTAQSSTLGTSQSSGTGNAQPPGTSQSKTNQGDYCDDDSPLEQYKKDKINPKLIHGMLSYKASNMKPWVTHLLIDQSRIHVTFDTMEKIVIGSDNISLGRLMKECNASYTIALESETFRKKIFFIDSAILSHFFMYTEAIYISGKFAVDALENLMPYLKVSKYNVHRWEVEFVGRLASLTRMHFPRQMNDLYFDARGTDNASLVDNISRLYMDTYERDHEGRPFLVSLHLIVQSFCALGNALSAQLTRISQMLRNDVPSSAAIVTDALGYDNIMEDLLARGFQYTHNGFIETRQGQMVEIGYWTQTEKNKTLVLGFRVRKRLEMTKEETPIVKDL